MYKKCCDLHDDIKYSTWDLTESITVCPAQASPNNPLEKHASIMSIAYLLNHSIQHTSSGTFDEFFNILDAINSNIRWKRYHYTKEVQASTSLITPGFCCRYMHVLPPSDISRQFYNCQIIKPSLAFAKPSGVFWNLLERLLISYEVEKDPSIKPSFATACEKAASSWIYLMIWSISRYFS